MLVTNYRKYAYIIEKEDNLSLNSYHFSLYIYRSYMDDSRYSLYLDLKLFKELYLKDSCSVIDHIDTENLRG